MPRLRRQEYLVWTRSRALTGLPWPTARRSRLQHSFSRPFRRKALQEPRIEESVEAIPARQTWWPGSALCARAGGKSLGQTTAPDRTDARITSTQPIHQKCPNWSHAIQGPCQESDGKCMRYMHEEECCRRISVFRSFVCILPLSVRSA